MTALASESTPRSEPRWNQLPGGAGALLAIVFGLPLAFVLGAAGFVWCAPAVFMTVNLARMDSMRVPRGSVPLFLFLGWLSLSVLRVEDVPTLFLFVYRGLLFYSLAAAYLWVVNVPTSVLSSERIAGWLSTLWMVLVGFGCAALLFPDLEFASPLQRVLPGSLLANDFLTDLTALRFTEQQSFLQFDFARPAAPMTYANGWGSTIGLLTPFFVQQWILVRDRQRKLRGLLIGAVAFVPMVLSLNRGLWLSLAVGAAYVAVVEASRGRQKMLGAVLAVGMVALLAVVLSPLGDSVTERLESTEDSNQDRNSVYVEAYTETLDSPLLGYGQPQQRDGALPVGTHGLLWYIMFSHGFPAMALFLWWLCSITWSSRRAPSPVALWSHVCIVIVLLQIFFYGLLPQIVILGVAAGLSVRERVAARRAGLPDNVVVAAWPKAR